MKHLLIMMMLMAIGGCAATAKTEVKHGRKGLHISCSGLNSSWNQCYASAASACSNKGYKVVAKSGEGTEEEGDFLFGLNPAGYTSRSMIVICR